MLSFEQLKALAEDVVLQGGEPEICLNFSDKKNDYMIITFEGKCSFQHCAAQGFKTFDGSGEFWYRSFDELYETETVDRILLKRDWGKITDVWCDDIDFEKYE